MSNENIEEIVGQKWEQTFIDKNRGGIDHGIYLLSEDLKSTSYIHTNNKELPMETRVYTALTHLAMHYVCRIKGDLVPTFDTYVAARLHSYITGGDSVIPTDVVIELIKRFGILDGLLEVGRSYYDQYLIASDLKKIGWFSEEKVKDIIEGLQENMKHE